MRWLDLMQLDGCVGGGGLHCLNVLFQFFLIAIVLAVGETGSNCNIFHIHAHYAEHVFY